MATKRSRARTSWTDLGLHPNSRQALALRHRELAESEALFATSRIGVMRRMARGKKVLDVGCVSHNFQFRSGGGRRWLHQHIVEEAAECVGVDYDEVGVKEMREAGYDVIHADITGDLSAIRERGPFDVVTAGEIIEHLPAPQALLSMAYEVLRPGGRLVISTPNPYSPRRQRTGALGVTWENVDHVVYLFPSGMAEMARRTGLVLKRYGTVGWPPKRSLSKNLASSMKVLLRASAARTFKGRTNSLSSGERLALRTPTFWLSPLDALLMRLRGRRGMLGETSIYVLAKPLRPTSR